MPKMRRSRLDAVMNSKDLSAHPTGLERLEHPFKVSEPTKQNINPKEPPPIMSLLTILKNINPP
jgi:hypothetical protein